MQHRRILSPAQQFFHNPWVRLFLVFDVIILIVLIGVLIWQSTRVSTLNFNITPLDATITVNGDNSYANGQYSITPGNYDITISRDGFKSKSFTIDIAPERIVSVSTFLTDKEGNYDFYKKRENFPSYQKLAEIASPDNNLTTDQDTSADSFIKRFQADYEAIATKLPIEYRESDGYGSDLSILKNITIKAKYDCEYTLCIEALIVGTDNKSFINALLRDKGFNVEDYEIEYNFY